eukprot:PITA_01475
MNFITRLPKTVRQHDSIMVVVDGLTKVAHFIPVKSKFSSSDVEQVFIREVVRLHGVPKKIVSDKDGQIERVNGILEDMLRIYVMHPQWKWNEYLPLVEFPYNNGYHESLRMSHFEALYGWSCNTLISWSYLVNRVLIGPEMLANMEQEMQVIKKNLKTTQDR